MKNIGVIIGKERSYISFEGTDYLIGKPYSAYLSVALGLKKAQLQLS